MNARFRAALDRFAGRTGLSRSVMTLLTGASSALLIAYLAQPVLTRLYSPEAFGLFDAFAAIVGLIIPFASLRYEDAIMLPDDDEEATGVIALSLVIAVVIALLSLVIYAGVSWIGAFSDDSAVARWLPWIPPVLLASRFAKLGEQWLARQKRFSSISKGQFAQSGATALTRITMGVGSLQSTPLGLIAGYLAGFGTAALWYGYALSAATVRLGRRYFRSANLLRIAERYRRFPLFSMPSALLNTLLSRLPVLLLLYFFSPEVVGYFGRAIAIFSIPLGVLGAAFAQVFFVEGALVRRTSAFPRLTLDVHRHLVSLGLFPTLAVMVAGPQAIAFVLGENWVTAGEYLRWIAPWLFLAGVASPLTRVFDILEKQRNDLAASALMFLIQTTLMILGGFTGNIATALFLLSAGGVATRLLHIVIILRLAGVSLAAAARHYVEYGLQSLPFLAVLYGVTLLDKPWLTTVVLLVCGAVVMYRLTISGQSRANGLSNESKVD